MLSGWRSCCFFWDLTRYGKKEATLFTDTQMEELPPSLTTVEEL